MSAEDMAPAPVTIPVPLCEGAVGHRVQEAPPQPRVGPGRPGRCGETRRWYRSFDGTGPGEPPGAGGSEGLGRSVLPMFSRLEGWV